MSEKLINFDGNIVALPYALEERLAHWSALRKEMVRRVPPAFTRDEWAYLVGFLDAEHLRGVFKTTFGDQRNAPARSLRRPRGPVAIWLPNNVSLLGPLVLVLTSFCGQTIKVKVGSKSNELCGAFLDFCQRNLPAGELKDYLSNGIEMRAFGRDDPRNLEMAASAAVRIAFGSDEAVSSIHAMPHPVDSVGISFGHRRSEAWIKGNPIEDQGIDTLLKVFAIYGQAGCTSPRRLVLIDSSLEEAFALRDRMLQRWSQAIKGQTAMHIASANIMALQLNRAKGWDAAMAPRNAGMLGVGSLTQGEMDGLMSLPISWGSIQDAARELPRNIQTLGYMGMKAEELLPAIIPTYIKRLVPLGQMHHFGPIWDGSNFWSQLFEEVAVAV